MVWLITKCHCRNIHSKSQTQASSDILQRVSTVTIYWSLLESLLSEDYSHLCGTSTVVCEGHSWKHLHNILICCSQMEIPVFGKYEDRYESVWVIAYVRLISLLHFLSIIDKLYFYLIFHIDISPIQLWLTMINTLYVEMLFWWLRHTAVPIYGLLHYWCILWWDAVLCFCALHLWKSHSNGWHKRCWHHWKNILMHGRVLIRYWSIHRASRPSTMHYRYWRML